MRSNPQPNDGDANGAFYAPLSLTFWNQSRCSSSTAHYRPIVDKRPNFHLIANQSVAKILIDQKSKQATGVQVSQIGIIRVSLLNFLTCDTQQFVSRRTTLTIHTVSACQEVILAAGALRSPGILQLSGVGPKKLLSGLGIEILEDLPGVGYNFHDQPSIFMALSCTPDIPSSSHNNNNNIILNLLADSNYSLPSPDWLNTNQTWDAEQLALYYKNRTGKRRTFYGNRWITETRAKGAYTLPYFSGTSVCFLPLQNVTSQYQQIIESAAAVDLSKILPAGADHTLLRGYKVQQDIILSLYASPHATVQETAFAGGATVPVVLLKPLSRGSILINSTNPLDDPVFDYGTFNHPADLTVAVASIKRNRDFFTSGPMKEVGAVETVPGPQITSDQALEEAIRGLATSTWSHPVGTLAMMKRKYGGVVDPQLRVYGIKGLRVVDASVFPIIPATHTSSTAYAVAEKVSSNIAF